MAGGRVILTQVGGVEIEVETVPVAGTEQMVGRMSKAAGNVVEAFGRAQETIIGVARSTTEMINRTGAAARPDRVEVEFGLKFSATGGVIMAGVAGEATLKVTLGYDVAARPIAAAAAKVSAEAAEPLPEDAELSAEAGEPLPEAAEPVPGAAGLPAEAAEPLAEAAEPVPETGSDGGGAGVP